MRFRSCAGGVKPRACVTGLKTEADLLIVGGGINGIGIARDAAGRGLRVVLAEQGDLGCATSSASSKLIHGGLRYLEQFEFRLVAEALAEREVLLRAAPHLVRPMRFVMPQAPGLRPGWMIRTGLFLYDWLARRQTLPASTVIELAGGRGTGLKPAYLLGYSYSDCWVDDARLVIANALDATERGARIMPRTRFVSAAREQSQWRARLQGRSGEMVVEARAIVNAAGPWVARVVEAAGERCAERLKLVQGSHVIVPRLYDGDRAYILQNDDRRVIFVYPYEGAYTLIGTTDVELQGDPRACSASQNEIAYLCDAANRYFVKQVTPAEVHWSYCGVRALVDDGSANPSAVSRDYRLTLAGTEGKAPLLSVFGGKITTYRRLAERVLAKLERAFPLMTEPWTAGARLPGGDVPDGDLEVYRATLSAEYPLLPSGLLGALAARHGSRTPVVLGNAKTREDLGEDFGAHLYAREVDYLVAHEWAHDADDVLWRRTKAGLHLDAQQRARVAAYVANSVLHA